MTRTFLPGRGVRTFRPPATPRSEPRSVSPHEQRRLWRGVAEAVVFEADGNWSPEMAGLANAPMPSPLLRALKDLGKTPFPLPAADVRAEIASGVERAIRAWSRLGEGGNRAKAAPLVRAGAAWMLDILHDQAGAIARAGNARIDPSERD